MDGTSSLQLKAALIAFHRIRGAHDGEALARTVLALLDRAGITVKVMVFFAWSEHISDIHFQDGPFHVGQCQ